MSKKKQWYRVLSSRQQLKEGRVMTVSAGKQDVCLTCYKGKIAALDNKCPHQGGPLGEGSIENGFLRCPWHGWDFDPITGKPPGGYDDGIDTYEVKVEDGAVYVLMEEEEKHVQTIADVMAETMVNWGIDTVFGMVGHSNLAVADAFRRLEKQGRLRYFGVRHEGAASFAASAYGKLTGKPAVCFSIAGPGATNMYTGMWDAKVDRAPLLAITGQVATQVVGTGNFQELDLIQAFESVAEFNHRVQSNSMHAELMSLAIKHSLLRRDVSHLTFPNEVQFSSCPQGKAATPKGRMGQQKVLPEESLLKTITQVIEKSRRPVIVVGHGARHSMDRITQLAERLSCPVLTTFKGKGLIPDNHPLACSVLGRSGTPIASWFMNESDLLIVLGASFSNHTGITSKKPIIQIDMDPLHLAKFHSVTYPVWGELSLTLDWILGNLSHIESKDHRQEIKERWMIWRKEKQRRLTEYRDNGLHSVQVFDALSKWAPDNAVFAVDVGNNTYSFGRYFESRKHDIVMSGYLGSIGFALPAAMGAYAALGQKRPIWAVAGDGGFGQYLAEWTTVVKYKMPIKMVVLNNQELGKISKEQRAIELDIWQTKLVNPSFATYAKSCGSLGLLVTKPDQLVSTLQKINAHKGPALIEIQTDSQLI